MQSANPPWSSELREVKKRISHHDKYAALRFSAVGENLLNGFIAAQYGTGTD